MTIRFAVWAAVSQKRQATKDKDPLEDKDSLPNQIKRSRLEGQSRGWIESHEPFVVPGKSRTQYVDITTAERHIPQLKEMLDSAERGDFDVLVCFDLSRFRSLGRQIADVLADSRVQIYSLAEPVDPQLPERFDPAHAYTASVMQDASGMASRAEIMIKTERWRGGIKGRVEKGLAPTGNRHYGYRKPIHQEYNPKAVFEPDPSIALVCVTMKDLFLAGQSLIQIQDYLNTKRIPSPRGGRWNYLTIRYILRNPYYAGIIEWGRMKTQARRRIGKRVASKADPSAICQNNGLHSPLWDKSTHQAILAEFKRRGRSYRGRKVSQFSSLLKCSVCEASLWVNFSGPQGKRIKYWRCSRAYEAIRKHVYANDAKLLPLVAAAVADGLQHIDKLTMPEKKQDRRPELLKALREIEGRRQRWMDAYESGRFSLTDFTARIDPLKTKYNELKTEISDLDNAKALRETHRQAVRQLTGAIDDVQAFIEKGNPQEVNNLLRGILESIMIGKDGKIELRWSVVS